jgi:hypothetical protein
MCDWILVHMQSFFGAFYSSKSKRKVVILEGRHSDDVYMGCSWLICPIHYYFWYFCDGYSKLMFWWFSITPPKASIRDRTFLFYTADSIFGISKVFSTNPFLSKSSKPRIILLKCSINQFRLLFYDSTFFISCNNDYLWNSSLSLVNDYSRAVTATKCYKIPACGGCPYPIFTL